MENAIWLAADVTNSYSWKTSRCSDDIADIEVVMLVEMMMTMMLVVVVVAVAAVALKKNITLTTIQWH